MLAQNSNAITTGLTAAGIMIMTIIMMMMIMTIIIIIAVIALAMCPSSVQEVLTNA